MQRPAHMALPSLQVTSASWPSTQWGASLKWELHQHWGYFGHPCAHFGRHLVGKFQVALWAPSWARWAPFGALWALPGTTLLTPLAQLETDELCTPLRWHCAESLTYAGCCKFSIYTAFAWARAGAATCFSDRTSRSNPRIVRSAGTIGPGPTQHSRGYRRPCAESQTCSGCCKFSDLHHIHLGLYRCSHFPRCSHSLQRSCEQLLSPHCFLRWRNCCQPNSEFH
jgi:hypothetical protein